jgi:phosphoglycolate phosphatase
VVSAQCERCRRPLRFSPGRGWRCRGAAACLDYDCSASIFGKPAKFRRILLRRSGVDPAQAIAIGDETRDIEAARATGIACAAVTWGYAAPNALKALGPDVIFDRIGDIAPRLIAADRSKSSDA